MTDSIENRVIAIIANQAVLEPEDVSKGQSLDDLGIDSLGLVESIFAIEEEFDIQVPYNANEPEASDFDISTVGAIVTAVEQLVRDQKG